MLEKLSVSLCQVLNSVRGHGADKIRYFYAGRGSNCRSESGSRVIGPDHIKCEKNEGKEGR